MNVADGVSIVSVLCAAEDRNKSRISADPV